MIPRFRFYLLLSISIIVNNCGTVYVPQTLPEGRGISRSEGQEKINISVIPLTNKIIAKANEDNYVRRVIDAGDLSSAAKLISVDQAINEKLPSSDDPGPYRVGIGDGLTISQMINVKDETGFSKRIAARRISIADDGFASIIGIGRIPLIGLTQFEAEDLLYERLVLEEVNPEFEDCDVALVLGANDVVNPSARHDTSSPIYGMPILDVDKSRTVIINKRTMNTGFAGIQNELFGFDNSIMVFGDAKDMLQQLLKDLKDL